MADKPLDLSKMTPASWDGPVKGVPLDTIRRLDASTKEMGSPMCQRCLSPVAEGESLCEDCKHAEDCP